MGFASLWASITGPRVKEISPSSPDFWPERGRPTTSSAVRIGRGDTHAEEQDDERRAKRSRFARSFSRPRRAQTARERAASRPRERTYDLERNAEKDLPDVPSVPTLPSLPFDIPSEEPKADEAKPEDVGRPGTAITTEGLQALSIFELAAEPPTPEETAEALTDPVPNRGRVRSKSAGPDGRPSLTKKASWFRLGSSYRDKGLPPPPPTCAPPPLPPNALLHPSSSELPRAPSVESQSAIVTDGSSNRERTSTSTSTAKSTLDDDSSLLDSFPLPRLVHDIDETPDSSIADYSSEASSMHQSSSPVRESITFRYKKVPTPLSLGVAASYGHKHKDSAISTPKSPHTPTGIKRWTRQASSSFEEDTLRLPGPLDINFEDWAGEITGQPASTGAHATNDRALAALEFGTLK